MSPAQAHDFFFRFLWCGQEAVQAVARGLRDRGLKTFLARWYLTTGRNLLQALEEALAACRTIDLFVGPTGLGSSQQRAQYLAMNCRARQPDFLVIPVLLPSAGPARGFLTLNPWVDLQKAPDDLIPALLAVTVQGQALRREVPPHTPVILNATMLAP